MTPGLDRLIGTSYGPFACEVTGERAAAFSSAIGGERPPPTDEAPATFANAVLFAAAPHFLRDPAVVPYTRSLLHSEQSFEWSRPLQVGEHLTVHGSVEGVRTRGALNLVSFALEASGEEGPWMQGRSVFVMSDQAASGAEELDEPAEDARPPFDTGGEPEALPAVGESLLTARCGASRADLMRYAAAAEDWNPIHFDHDAARSAGLGGVIVHGLLMGAWLARLAERYGSLSSLRLRFRDPLRPAVAAEAGGVVADIGADFAELDLLLTASGRRLVTGRAVVTP